MSEVTLYDSRGYPLDDPDGERNEKIRNMSRYGVVFTISDAQPFELTTYFRAYESSSGRMEQYYASYITSSDHALLREFREAVIDVAETDHGLKIERSESGENVLSNLDAADPGQVGTDRQRSRARELLSGGERLRFGVSSYEKAFELISEVGGARVGMEIAVTEGESTHTGPMSTYDLIVEKGPYMGLEPIGQTQALMNPEPDASDGEIDGDSIAEIAVDIGYGVAVVGVLALLYFAVAGALFSPLGLATLDGAAEAPWAHNVTVEINDTDPAVVVSGSTPADTLILEYVNETNSTPVSDGPFKIRNNRNFNHTNRSIPANADFVRIRSPGIIEWKVASTKDLPAGNNGGITSTSPQIATATPAGRWPCRNTWSRSARPADARTRAWTSGVNVSTDVTEELVSDMMRNERCRTSPLLWESQIPRV
jgi:hypothetical protein